VCGICGFSGPRAVDKTKMRWLLVENQSRGTDSTGVYGNHLFKDNVMAKVFIQSYDFNRAIQGAHTVIGHTRLGTYGAKTKENSHPFIYSAGDDDKWAIVGAHNGFVIQQIIT
jgi:glutamine phosphoribosylpyrophosphate amidotransferase